MQHEERETQSFHADCFYIVNSQPNQRAAPVAHKESEREDERQRWKDVTPTARGL